MKIRSTTAIKEYFGKKRTLFAASAPGRLDVMGGIADYSGSLVLQMPIRERTTAIVSEREDGIIRVHSDAAENMGLPEEVCIECDPLMKAGNDRNYSKTRKMVEKLPGGEWAAYVIGCFLVLSREKSAKIHGADVWIESHVPIGKGVSSSAAIEVAVMTALDALYKLKLRKSELPILAQKVENLIVGAPCGLMDQLACYLGEEGRLLPILCQPDQVSETLPIPEDIHFVGIDSGVRHAVSGASYTDVRIAAFMGYSIIAQNEGIQQKDLKYAKESHDYSNLPFSGYVANISPSQFETRYREILPEQLNGRRFLESYGETIDPVTTIKKQSIYRIRDCTVHPVYENRRVGNFRLLLQSLGYLEKKNRKREDYLVALGEYMFQSHASYSRCGLGNNVTDELVESIRQSGAASGVYGAKITGGGSGGTVCVLCKGKKGIATAKTIARKNAQKYGIEPIFFVGSGNGAQLTGVQIMEI